MPDRTVRFVVDRRESKFLVMVDESGASRDVPANALPPQCRGEGAVLDVPLNDKGEPLWQRAARNKDEEERRMRDATAQLERLKRTDPGGDIEL